jgi:serine/threonine-protein kinase
MFQGGGGQSAVKTAAGVLLGTPQYMSPEACESRANLDHRTDIYALGILVFQMMTGMLPFDGETMGEVLVKQVTQLPPPPRGINPQIPPSVEQVVLRCLAKNPDARFPTMQSLRDALLNPEAYLGASPPIAPARSLAPGEIKVDAKTVMAYAAQEAAARQAQLPLQPPPPSMSGNAQAKTMIADGPIIPPRPATGAMAPAPPNLIPPTMPKMNTMRIATPLGYSSRPPRRMWPVVLVIALLLGLGGGAFAVAWFGRDKPGAAASDAAAAAPLDAAAAKPGGSGSASVTAATPQVKASGITPSPSGSGSTPSPSGSGSTPSPSGSGAGSAASTPPAPSGSGAPVKSDVAMAVVVIDSTPQGADVFGPDKKNLGKTPLKLDLPISDMPLEFELRLAGHRKKTKQIIVSANTMVQVPLERAPSTGGSSGTSGSSKGSARPSDTALERPD